MAKILSGLITFGMILVAVVVFLATGVGDRQQAAQHRRFAEERHAVEMQVLREQTARELAEARQLSPVKTAAEGLALMGGAFTALGAGYYVVSELRKRSRLVWPNRAGIFPQVTVELGNGARAFHDPNRSPVATTIYSPEPDGGVRITPVILPGLTNSVRQAAAVQLTAAAVHRGTPLTEDAQNVARRFLPGDPAQSGAPAVRVLAAATDQVDKLLEATDDDDTG